MTEIVTKQHEKQCIEGMNKLSESRNYSKIAAILIGIMGILVLSYYHPNYAFTTGEQVILVMQCGFFVLWGLY